MIINEEHKKELEKYTGYRDESDTIQADIINFNIIMIETFLKNVIVR